MNRRAEIAVEKRADVSMFMVHLTRDDRTHTAPNVTGMTVEENFASIFEQKRIAAFGIHCLHGDRLKRLPEKKQRQFRVACFTETPLDQIRGLLDVGPRQIDLEPYGFVFKREFLYAMGAQPAHYLNNYHPNPLRDAVECIYEMGLKNNFTGRTWPLLPLVNVMQDNHDFVWEREYRVIGDVEFEYDDLVCVILPDHEYELRERMAGLGITALDPGWSYEKMVLEFSEQQRSTRRIAKAAAAKPKAKATA